MIKPKHPKNHTTEGDMDDKEIGLNFVRWFTDNVQVIYASSLAVGIAFLRIAYDYSTGRVRRTWAATITECLLCGSLTLASSSALEFFGLPATASTWVGGGIGLFGVDKLRAWAERWIEKDKLKKDAEET